MCECPRRSVTLCNVTFANSGRIKFSTSMLSRPVRSRQKFLTGPPPTPVRIPPIIWGGVPRAFFRSYGPFFKSGNLATQTGNRPTPESVYFGGCGPYLGGRRTHSAGVPEMCNSVANDPRRNVRSTLDRPLCFLYDAECLCLGAVTHNHQRLDIVPIEPQVHTSHGD